jgi:hypothetical protein
VVVRGTAGDFPRRDHTAVASWRGVLECGVGEMLLELRGDKVTQEGPRGRSPVGRSRARDGVLCARNGTARGGRETGFTLAHMSASEERKGADGRAVRPRVLPRGCGLGRALGQGPGDGVGPSGGEG